VVPVRESDSWTVVRDRAIAYRRVSVRIADMELHGTGTATMKASGGADGVRDAKGVEAGPTPATSSPPVAERVARSAGENTERNVDCSNGRNVRPGRSISGDNNMNIFKMPRLFADKVLFKKPTILYKFV